MLAVASGRRTVEAQPAFQGQGTMAMTSKKTKVAGKGAEWREHILRAEVNSWLKKHGLRER